MKPEAVTMAGIHSPGSFLPGNKSLTVQEDDMHYVHFRECNQTYLKVFCMNCTPCEKFTSTDDDTAMDNFGRSLIKRVKERMDLLNFDILHTSNIYQYHPTPSTTTGSPLTDTDTTSSRKPTTTKTTSRKMTTTTMTTTMKTTSTTTKA